MRFDWDVNKAVENFAKHGVSFEEATEVFFDENALEGYDYEHSAAEDRFFIVGLSFTRLLYVVYVERFKESVRIISARRAVKENESFMNEEKIKDEGFAFTVIDDDGENVTIEVSEEDYLREKAAGVDEESLLKPGRYKVKRGGFLARHPELKIGDRKRA